MGRIVDGNYTVLSERTIAGTGLGTSPEAIAGLSDLQRAVYQDQPADTQDALDTATEAGGKADAAQGSADAAAASAADAGTRADAAQASANKAQDRADAAYTLADGKVAKDAGPTFSAPSAAPARTALPAYAGGTAAATYTQADMQAAMDQIAALTSRVAALIVDLRGNHSLTN